MASTVVLTLYSLLLTSVSCTQLTPIFRAIINEVISPDKIAAKVSSTLGDSDEASMAALQMFDASTKFPNGLVVGNFFDLGNFDECLAIKYKNLYGKYCLGTLPLSSLNITSTTILPDKFSIPRQPFAMHPQPRLVSLGEDYTGFHFAACVPSNWSAADIPGSLIYTEDFCYSKATERELSAGAIATIVILAVILAIMVASTLFDLFLFYTNRASPHELLVSFSVLSNGRKIFQASKNPDQLLCLNGIKAISMMWVIIGHEYSLVINSAVSNLPDAKEWENEAVNMFIVGATVSVDTFFVVGGLVTVYTYLKSMAKGVKFNVLLFYLHRYLRLTPALAIMALIHLYLINHFGDGPLWKVVDFTLVQTCQRGWWSTFLYITNYVKHDQCLPQTWYLSVDMQLFVLAPIVLIPLSRWPKIGLGLLGVLTVAGVVAPFSIGYAKNLGNMLSDPNYMSEYYTQTYARFGPYVIGMILGYFLYKIKQAEMRLRLPPIVVCALWLVCLTGLVACVWAGHPLVAAEEPDRWGNSMYLAFNRQSWSVALCGVILLCVSGYGGPVDAFLSLPIFQFLTKLSYSMYLVHYSVITVRYAVVRNIIKFSDIALMHSFWGDFIFTLVLSLVLCLSFESPVITLEKHLIESMQSLFERRKPKEDLEKKPEV